MINNKMNIVYKKVEELIPYVNNPRNNKEAIDKVASSIKNFGFKVPIVVDSQNEVITGHTRLLASKKLGIEEVPVIIADDLSEAQVKAFRIADNKVSEYAEWDEDLLKLELEQLEDMGFDDYDFGFNFEIEYDEEIDSFIEDLMDNEFYEQGKINDRETFNITFTFDNTHKKEIDAFIKSNGKQYIVQLITDEVMKNNDDVNEEENNEEKEIF